MHPFPHFLWLIVAVDAVDSMVFHVDHWHHRKCPLHELGCLCDGVILNDFKASMQLHRLVAVVVVVVSPHSLLLSWYQLK
jgi:hypothetical protein